MSDNEQLVSMKMSQYEMLSDTLRQIIEEDKDPSSIGSVLDSIKETIDGIYELRRIIENEKNEIPRRKRNVVSQDVVIGHEDDVKLVDPNNFVIHLDSWLGISDDLVKRVRHADYGEKCVYVEVFNASIRNESTDNKFIPIVVLLDDYKNGENELDYGSTFSIDVFSKDGELLFTEVYDGCSVDEFMEYGAYSRDDYDSDYGEQLLGVKIKYMKKRYIYYGEDAEKEER